MVTITEPGVYEMDDADYHADPIEGGSLSASGARRLLPPYCPAIYRYEQTHPRFKQAFDFGHAAHKLVLGNGADLDVIGADDYRTKAAQEQRDLAHAEGRIPLLPKEHAVVKAMAEAVLQHPIARALLDPDSGRSEQSMFWRDDRTGVWRRSRVDWLPNKVDGTRLIAVDYKTLVSANPDKFAKSAADFGYHQQASFYLDGITALDLGDEPAFVFVVQEKSPPFLVSVVELDATALRIGTALNRQAIDVYAECVATNTWPGYSDEVQHVSLPYWYEAKTMQEIGL